MTEAEAIIITNQGMILTALAFLVPELSELCLKSTNRTVDYVEKEMKNEQSSRNSNSVPS
jgi:hypothetical protein